MELEAAHAVSRISRRTSSTAFGRCGSTLANGMRTSGFAAATSSDLLVPHRGPARHRLGVDGEDDRQHVALAVVGGDVLDRRRPALAEVLLRRLAPLGQEAVLARAPDLGVRVHVDRDDPVEVDVTRLTLRFVIPVVWPPLAVSTWPWTKFDHGEQRKKIGPAASSGVAGRPSGMIIGAICRIRSGMPSGISTPSLTKLSPPSSEAAVRRVSTNPNATALTFTLNGPHSRASVFVSPTSPAFAAE